MLGTVIDRKTLVNFAAKLASYLATIVTALLALNTSDTPAIVDEPCALTAVQAGSIRALMADRNASCAYNITLASIID